MKPFGRDFFSGLGAAFRRWKYICLFLTVVVLVAAVDHFYWKYRVDAYKRWLLSRGEKLKIAEVLPPAVPMEQNGAALVRSAISMLSSVQYDYTNQLDSMQMIAPGKAIVGWAQANIRDRYFTNTWDDVMAVNDAAQPGLELLKQAMNRPGLDFHPDYEQGATLKLPYLAQVTACAARLNTAVLCDLHRADATSATSNLCTLLALTQHMHDERTMISQQVRFSMAYIATKACWELLQSTNLTETELAGLQKSWEALEFVKSSENAVEMERNLMESSVAKMRNSRADFQTVMVFYGKSGERDSPSADDSSEIFAEFIGAGIQKAKHAGLISMWRISWTYSDEQLALQNYQAILETLRSIETNRIFQPANSNLDNHLEAQNNPQGGYEWILKGVDNLELHRLFSQDSGIPDYFFGKIIAIETARQVVITAIALQRYKLKHSEFPGTLSELEPEFLPSAPLDPVDGKPLRYRRNADGRYWLYSAGMDGMDNGGDPTSKFGRVIIWLGSDVRDWVWPQPATPADVQAWYAHPPK